ncbi:DNA polymerase I [bacterium]|nr:DNA polymerase I [bacterium]
MQNERKLFLLDAMALIYRAYFALNKNPRITSTGINTSAFLGFANTLLELLRKEKPTHIGVAFDTMAPTARHLEYTEYKANREKMPEDIGIAIPYIQRLLEALHIPVLYAEGYEADDVIGTLSKKAEKEGFTVYMVTPDKDFGQLVSDKVFMYKPAHGGNGVEILGPAEVCAKFGIENPLQVIDMLGLWGDAADNIPGIPGVGEVTARKLLAQFGSVENLLERSDEIANEKLREKVKQNEGQARESKMLATILLDAPVEFNEEELQLRQPDIEKVTALLDELEMRTLSVRLLSYYAGLKSAAVSVEETPSPSVEVSAPSVPQTVEVVVPAVTRTPLCTEKEAKKAVLWKTADDLQKGLSQLRQTGSPVAFYLHPVTASSIRKSGVDALFFAQTEGSHNSYIYIPADSTRFSAEERQALEELFQCPLLCYDLKNLLHLFVNMGMESVLEHDFPAFDVMLAHYLADPETGHDLSRLVQNYLPCTYAEDTSGKDLFSTVDFSFGLQNVKACLLLEQKLRPLLEDVGAEELFAKVEMPLASVLCRMERIGVKLDTARLAAYGRELAEQIKQVESEIYEAAGEKFNIASPKQLGEILYEKLQITEKPKQTKTKQYSTAEDILQKLLPKHPIVEKVLRYRSLTKLKSTYVDALPQLIDTQTGRIHTTYNQAVTATGRLSSQNPNLQNIPIRTEMGKEIRRCFVAGSAENQLLASDYSQIELRIIAHLSGDEVMLRDFSQHKDVHTATASNVFGVKPEEVTSEMRRKAKTVNFGIIYGISAFGLADRLQIPRKEAADLIERYYANYPALRQYMEKVVSEAKEKGYVETMLHRRRYLQDINSGNAVVRAYAERNAVNAPVQGSSADMIKVAMIAIDRRIRRENLKARMILQVHDELVFDVPQNELSAMKVLVEEEMKNALPMRVPVEVEQNAADNWLDAH